MNLLMMMNEAKLSYHIAISRFAHFYSRANGIVTSRRYIGYICTIQSNLDISNSDISNSAKLEASI